MEEKNNVTLETIDARLERIETMLTKKEAETKEAKDWKDLKDLGGLALLIAGLGYLLYTGGVGALIGWIKGLLLP